MSVDSNSLINSFSAYACPDSRTSIVACGEASLRSSVTQKVYSIVDGVPIFSNTEIVDGSYDTKKIDEKVKLCREKGWREALMESGQASAEYITNESRAKYLEILPLTSDSTVLEIGASMGQHTHLIAKKCKHVYGLEVIPEQAVFAQLRCRQMGYSNVSVAAGGEDCSLPYLDNSFNVVVFNYVLEWCAGRSTIDAKDVHRKILSECHRVLRPGGHLFVSTKNRYALRLLKGGIDEHVDMRFGNALPRWMMSFLLKYRQENIHKPYGYLHSFGALKEIVTDAGFNNTNAYWAIPDGRYPEAYIPFERDAVQQAKANPILVNANRTTKILMKYLPLTLVPWLTPSLVFLAEKPK